MSIYPLSNLLWAWSTSCENTLITFASDRKTGERVKGDDAGCVALLLARSGRHWRIQPKNAKRWERLYIVKKLPTIYAPSYIPFYFLMYYLFLYLLNSLSITIICHFVRQYDCQNISLLLMKRINVSIKYIHSLNRYKKRMIFKGKL